MAMNRPVTGEKSNTDYHIKINGPEFKENDHEYDTNKNIHFNEDSTHQKLLGHQNIHPHVVEENMLPKAEKIQYKDKITGYDINKECLSEEQLLRSFRILDIGKDEQISEEDLSFVLDYLKEDYTQEEVKEMINMLSSDKKYVNFEDFKKLGQGSILPLANFKMPDLSTSKKQQILSNIEDFHFLEEDPDEIIDCLKNGVISYAKFE